MSNKEHWIILWLGIDEFTIIDGTLEDAIREARQDIDVTSIQAIKDCGIRLNLDG